MNDSSIILVDLLARYNVGEQESVLDNGGRCVVATRFDSKDIIRHILQRLFIERQRYNYFRQSNGYLVSLLLQASGRTSPWLAVIEEGYQDIPGHHCGDGLRAFRLLDSVADSGGPDFCRKESRGGSGRRAERTRGILKNPPEAFLCVGTQ